MASTSIGSHIYQPFTEFSKHPWAEFVSVSDAEAGGLVWVFWSDFESGLKEGACNTTVRSVVLSSGLFFFFMYFLYFRAENSNSFMVKMFWE